MRGTKTPEPTLDELLGDDIMGPVLRSAGLDPARLRALLAELARRLDAQGIRLRCGSGHCAPPPQAA